MVPGMHSLSISYRSFTSQTKEVAYSRHIGNQYNKKNLKPYHRQIASRSAGPIANRITVLAFIISGATLQSNSSKFSRVMRKNFLNNTASKRSSWTSEWYSPCRDLLCRMGCTQKRRTPSRCLLCLLCNA